MGKNINEKIFPDGEDWWDEQNRLFLERFNTLWCETPQDLRLVYLNLIEECYKNIRVRGEIDNIKKNIEFEYIHEKEEIYKSKKFYKFIIPILIISFTIFLYMSESVNKFEYLVLFVLFTINFNIIKIKDFIKLEILKSKIDQIDLINVNTRHTIYDLCVDDIMSEIKQFNKPFDFNEKRLPSFWIKYKILNYVVREMENPLN